MSGMGKAAPHDQEIACPNEARSFFRETYIAR